MMPGYIHSAREEKAKTMEMDFEQVIRRWILLEIFSDFQKLLLYSLDFTSEKVLVVQ